MYDLGFVGKIGGTLCGVGRCLRPGLKGVVLRGLFQVGLLDEAFFVGFSCFSEVRMAARDERWCVARRAAMAGDVPLPFMGRATDKGHIHILSHRIRSHGGLVPPAEARERA